jgi:thioredoxin-dependent peroxiredoxin
VTAPQSRSVAEKRVGISMDDVRAQQGFADGEALDYPLLSDVDGAVAVAYGVRRRFITPMKRATFVITPDQVVRDVITSELNFDVHADKALESLRELRAA